MGHAVETGTILSLVESISRPGTVLKAIVRTASGRQEAIFGPGLYRITRSDQVPVGTEVLCTRGKPATIIGIVRNDS